MTLPSAGHALGLGDIHVSSALNEPLSAEIDIVGASPEDLIGITASVANREKFLQFGAERMNFLQSTTFKVGKDAHGRPVLAIRSTESFNEPMVDLVVDLRWRNGELIRQYTLLLDPAGFPSAPRAAQALSTPAGQAPVQAPLVSVPRPEVAAQNAPVLPARPARAAASEQPAEQSPSSLGSSERKTMKVGAKATLRGIAWRVGARSRPDINRLMFAIFRANPAAFDGNINRLHLGAMLTIPTADEVAAIPQSEANAEIRSQMSSWLSTWKGSSLASTQSTAATVAAPANVPAAPATAPLAAAPQPPVSQPHASQPAAAAQVSPAAPLPVAATPAATQAGAKAVDEMSNAELADKIQQLENSLREVQAQLAAEHSKMLNMQSQARYAEQHPAAVAATPAAAKPGQGYLGWLIGGVAVLLGAVGAFMLRSRRTPPRPNIPLEPMVEPVLAPPPKNTYGAAPAAAVAQPRPAMPVAAPVAQVRAMDDSMLELSQLEPSSDLSSELGIDHAEATHTADTADTAEVDTRGVDAARQRDDDAAVRMREELEAAWSIPAADSYQRFDETETTLAEAIEKSLVETSRLQAAKIDPVDQIDTAETAKNKAVDPTSTMDGAGETVVMEAETARLPAATLAMHAEEIARAFEEPTVQQPRPDPNQLDYNLLDLDTGAKPVDSLHNHVVVKDRRANPIEILKKDLQRERDRDDLRLKALEAYVAEAVSGREYAQVIDELTQVRELLTEAEWNKANDLVKQSAEQKGKDEDLFAA